MHCQPSIKAAQSATSIPKPSLMGSLSALDDPAAAGVRMVGSFRRFSPATTASTARHCGSRRILPCARLCTVAMTRCLASCPVSLWVVHLASREPARHCRPSDVKTSRHHQSGRSVEKFLPTSGLLSPQTPTLPPSTQLGFQSVGSHASNKRACMLSLDWSPCGRPSTPAI